MASRPAKRARPAVIQQRVRRPIDKKIVSVQKDNIAAATQVTTDLLTATFPCTVVGLRWDLHSVDATAGVVSELNWVIVLLRDGLSAQTISTSDGGDMYTPEQDVMAWGVMARTNDLEGSFMWKGDTKTMRKLMAGDKITIAIRNNHATDAHTTFYGAIQFFCKS